MPVADALLDDAAKERTRYFTRKNIRDEFNSLVPLKCGQRLVALFQKFIFPSYPVISRTQFGLTGSRQLPTQHALSSTPVHLLAAIYASTQSFAKFDEHLCVLSAYSQPPTERLWRLVLELILEEIHTPHLAVLRAGLLYLHRPINGQESAIADSPFTWSLVGLLVGVSTALGLQLECRPMGLPAWGKRLRRRLWWALYTEDKWRSLLYGRPPFIQADEWDVTDLDEADFRLDQPRIEILLSTSNQNQSDGIQFRHFARLSRIAAEVQQVLYWLRAAQRLSPNFPESLSTARSLLRSLKGWYAMLPTELKLLRI
ncbi:fungal specific transcription factor domain-containing protein [Aspergillus homomorphus CBS 101889]|uniref:Xylanolytic transcriptional activator regulatory domain-containing protein n=1 Tax=Aspergillus homomorphus (strain CBS 101889) TaxID=1450537 RepID=A0A395I347_ASPHC|nr:hypothetical protein BO97DRAFT_433031 [Aspergillus homomorphus CBS 101889]RAL14377.1 hypothetical protein BO97DRAFT_433031 [Aspergillus homomorphus CBS 101889]